MPVPFSQDQPFWANRLVALGAAPGVLPAGRLRADRLADALTDATTNPAFADAAALVGARLAREDGAAAVLRHVHQLVPGQGGSAPSPMRTAHEAANRSGRTWDPPSD